MKRIALDMDEVLVDTVAAQLEWFREHHGYRWSRDDLVGKRWEELASAASCAAHEELLREGSFFETLPPMQGAVEAVRRLLTRYELFVVSAAVEYPRSCAHKFAWLRRHVPEIPSTNIVFCGDKGIVAADWLVDDHPRNFRRFRGEGVLFDAPHNRHETAHRRVRSWAEVEELFLAR